MSAPPEVVFNTATDPDRSASWLPAPLRRSGVGRTEANSEALRATWNDPGGEGWTARLEVRPMAAGGATVRLGLAAADTARPLAEIADESLDNLASEVAENLTAG